MASILRSAIKTTITTAPASVPEAGAFLFAPLISRSDSLQAVPRRRYMQKPMKKARIHSFS
jgi:hypothetical protein